MIKINDVKYSYENSETEALRGVSISIADGEFVAIVGHNGSGKSTLAKMLNALQLPSSGSVTVFGMDTADESKTLDIRKKVGMVFQNPDNQIVTTVVEEDVGFGPENLGVPTEEILRRVHDALEAVDMLDYAKSAPHMLSGRNSALQLRECLQLSRRYSFLMKQRRCLTRSDGRMSFELLKT